MRWGFLPAIWMVLGLPAVAEAPLTPMQALGRSIFFDTGLSQPAGQSCASCHAPEVAFSSPMGAFMPGAVPGRFGNRAPPGITYAAFIPILHWDKAEKSFAGGQFRDGRAADLVEQAKGPFTNPAEMNNADMGEVCRKVMGRPYAGDFTAAFAEPLDCAGNGVPRILQALSAYEGGPEINPFSSKYDQALRGKAQLTAQELRGYTLYRGKAGCERCHPSTPGPRGEPPLFTDFGYDNIGAPKNPLNPQGSAYVDPGLGGFLNRPSELGKFRSPSLRNIAVNEQARAYMHNGALVGLRQVIEFYNKRDGEPERWVAEEPRTVNRRDLGDLKLSDQEIEDLLVFLRTLSDGYQNR